MRTLLQDLAQKSLKGLGTKACTNWEDRSANSLAYQVSNHSTFLYAGCLSLQSSHLMRAILEDFKGYSSALELAIDAFTTDTFCQNMQSEMCFTLKTPLLLLIIVVHNLQSMTSGRPLPSWRAHKMLHGDAWPLADLNQSVLCFLLLWDKLHHHLAVFQHFLWVWIFPHPSNIELKDRHDISQMAGDMTEILLDFVFSGKAQLETWMNQPVWSRLNMHSLHDKFAKAVCETWKWFHLVKGREGFTSCMCVHVWLSACTVHNTRRENTKFSL